MDWNTILLAICFFLFAYSLLSTMLYFQQKELVPAAIADSAERTRLLALVAMVAHAAQAIDHVWPWWVFGISIGIGILILFGIFEKKRAEVLLLIGRLKAWEL